MPSEASCAAASDCESTGLLGHVCDEGLCKALWLRGKLGTNSCPSSSVDIQDVGTCQTASISLGLTWGGTGSWNDFQGKCGSSSGNAYLNSHPTGAAWSFGQPICPNCATIISQASCEAAPTCDWLDSSCASCTTATTWATTSALCAQCDSHVWSDSG